MTDYLRVPILNDQWYVRVAWGDVPTLNALLKKWKFGDDGLDDNYWDRHWGGCAHAPGRPPVIVLPNPPSLDPFTLGVVAHEAHHAVNHLLRCIEVEAADEEILGHSQAAIVRAYAKYAVKHG